MLPPHKQSVLAVLPPPASQTATRGLAQDPPNGCIRSSIRNVRRYQSSPDLLGPSDWINVPAGPRTPAGTLLNILNNDLPGAIGPVVNRLEGRYGCLGPVMFCLVYT